MAALLMAAFTACTQEESLDDGGSGKIRYTLRIATPDLETEALDHDSRANAVNAKPNELMKSWLVIVEREGYLEDVHEWKIKDGEDGEEEERERDNVATFTAEKGPRNFYSFANIDESEVLALFQEAGYKYTDFVVDPDQPKELTPMDALKKLSYPVSHTGSKPSTILIPMTGVLENEEVDNNSTITLYVYRMLNRLRFRITNKSGNKVTIKKITMGDITQDNTTEKPSHIFFFPPQMRTAEITTAFPEGKHEVGDFVFYDNQTATDEEKVLMTLEKEDTEAHDYECYFSPSVASVHPTKHFPIRVEMEVENDKGEVITKETRFAVTSLNDIRRNSLVTIPITLTGYNMKLNAYHYAPIGSYPAVRITERNDTEFNCEFTGIGDFALRPYIFAYEDEKNPENWFELNDTRHILTKELKVDDPQKIFSVEPDFDAGSDIVGTFSTNKGTATVRLTVQIQGEGGVAQTFVRTFYVIHNEITEP